MKYKESMLINSQYRNRNDRMQLINQATEPKAYGEYLISNKKHKRKRDK